MEEKRWAGSLRAKPALFSSPLVLFSVQEFCHSVGCLSLASTLVNALGEMHTRTLATSVFYLTRLNFNFLVA